MNITGWRPSPRCKDSANREQNQIYLNYAEVQPVFAFAKELNDMPLMTVIDDNYQINVLSTKNGGNYSPLAALSAIARSTSARRSRFFTPTFLFSMPCTLVMWWMFALESPYFSDTSSTVQ